jgi:hypothetical protein
VNGKDGDDEGDLEEKAQEIAEKRLPLLLRGQIFTGMIAMQNQTKEDLTEFIDDLRSAGIHFTYFSKRTERQTKAFGERMGLETDWNCCISLADEEPEDITEKSKMPRGVQNVRPHLEDVDDIPLRLPLFANCDPDSVTEMMKIFQENGEVVLSVGVSSHESNVPAFAQVKEKSFFYLFLFLCLFLFLFCFCFVCLFCLFCLFFLFLVFVFVLFLFCFVFKHCL